MPHSSGGGHSSHSGGSHHSGGGSSSRGSSGSHMRKSGSYFPGSKRYVRYQNGMPIYFYANYDPSAKTSPLRFLMLLFYVPFLCAVVPIIGSSFHIPHKLPANYDQKIIIEDEYNMIDYAEESELRLSLEAFLDETGIAPSVVFISNDSWTEDYERYEDLYRDPNEYIERMAYSMYLQKFDDESHWLILISGDSEDSRHWPIFWEGMQGNDTDPIITEEIAESFNQSLENKTMLGKTSPCISIKDSFDELTPIIMKSNFVSQQFIFAILILAFVVVHAMFMTGIIGPKTYFKDAKPCDESSQTGVCGSCGGYYVTGLDAICPHCGAIIVDNSKKDSSKEETNGSVFARPTDNKYEMNGEDKDYYDTFFGNNSSSHYDE